MSAPPGAAAPALPGGLWGAWNADLLVLVPLLVLAWAYARGVQRVWRRAGRGGALARWQAAAFAGGWSACALALLSPLDALAHTLFSAHMVQHLLLVLVAAPLLALGAPLVPLLHALPAGWRARVHRLRPARSWRRGVGAALVLGAAVVAHVATMWVWHVPALYSAALASGAVHALEHVTMLATAFALWSLLVSGAGPARRPSPAAALAIFGVATLTVGLGAVLTFAPAGLYPVYAAGAAAWSLTLLEDQQLGGALMWTVGGVVYAAAGAGLAGWWLRDDQRRRERRERRVR